MYNKYNGKKTDQAEVNIELYNVYSCKYLLFVIKKLLNVVIIYY